MAPEDEYPYFVQMRGQSLCGGVLVAPRLAISAAHCFDASDSIVVMGTGDKIDIIDKIAHPNYVPGTYAWDIMLMHLESSDDEDDMVYVNLNSDPSVPSIGQSLTAIGMGIVGFHDESFVLPSTLQETQLLAVDMETCRFQYQAGEAEILAEGLVPQNVTDDQLCANAMGVGVCSGDSGSPLILKGDKPSKDTLIGTVAWTRGGCANNAFPDVFSSVSFFHSWIVETACDLSDNTPFDCDNLPTSSPSAAPTQSPTEK